MKTYVKLPILFVFMLIIIASCHKVNTYEGKATIISRTTDLTLKDSALIYGMVYSADKSKMPELTAIVWIDGTNIKTNVDSLGSFSLKIKPGTYTIKCSQCCITDNNAEELKDISILQNEKIKIEFLLKVVIE